MRTAAIDAQGRKLRTIKDSLSRDLAAVKVQTLDAFGQMMYCFSRGFALVVGG